ncbi:MAG: hypothetical protein PHH59_01700 [Methylovulum sp.]|uniref:hypothetical protein n=1 Tax=Methylovulum sp. TaxID=1916980 RepID=UPI002623C76D|nr:hypothetical protein [Methylovulum sp.]MDD2722723.1 hypothetical protein [Methylovulum sp.]MDD5123979.1 hypothetical protein [Methylovulum sp.]
MKIEQNSANFTRFFWGLGIFAISASTVALVTDPYLMADAGLVILGIYLMITGLKARKHE